MKRRDLSSREQPWRPWRRRAIITTDARPMRSKPMPRRKWIDNEFQPSTLSKDEQQMAEMEWFIKASKPFAGMQVSTVSEILKHPRL